MNGLIVSHNVKDHTNGDAPLRSLPVIIAFFCSLTSTTVPILCKVNFCFFHIAQISALKQNGLLQTLAAGGNQHKPEGKSNMLVT